MADLMRRHNISGIVVVEGTIPVGIVSLRDLLDLLALELTTIYGLTVREVMRTDLITIGRYEYLFKAIFKMAKHNIHRLVVLNFDGSLAGVVTNTDLLRIQTRCPLYLSQEIEASESFEQLRTTGLRMLDMLQFATKSGADTQSLISLIAHFNDAMTLRIIELLDSLEGVRLPENAAWLALGSEGRGEQTLRTDQDNAIVYADNLPQKELDEIKHFAERMVECLIFIGVPPCPGGVMASNPVWRNSVSGWKQTLLNWITSPSPKNMVSFGMFQDLRALYGSSELEQTLKEHIISVSHHHSLFFPYMARNIVRFMPPMGMFGRIKTESRGEHRGTFDLKKGGIFALTLGISLLTLHYGSMGGNTWEKIARLRETGKIGEYDLDQIEESFSFLLKLRLQKQFRAMESGRQPTNYVDPLVLNEREREQLRDAFKGVNLLLHLLKDTFQLDMIRM
jgi:CBS domain-containing protein